MCLYWWWLYLSSEWERVLRFVLNSFSTRWQCLCFTEKTLKTTSVGWRCGSRRWFREVERYFLLFLCGLCDKEQVCRSTVWIELMYLVSLIYNLSPMLIRSLNIHSTRVFKLTKLFSDICVLTWTTEKIISINFLIVWLIQKSLLTDTERFHS
jgi:hypothetical protein